MTDKKHIKAIHHQDQENARLASERAASPDGMTASERAMSKSAHRRKLPKPLNTVIYRKSEKSGVSLMVRSMGKALAVTAIIKGTADDANAYMAKHEREALVAIDGDLHIMADVSDRGEKIG